MEIHDERVPDDLFAEFTARMPEVCVQVVLERDGEVLLARRTNDPARGEWFWPGGRLYKGEALEEAARRVAREELGIAVEVEGLIGVYSHFWGTSSLPGSPSRHTVNADYHVTPADSAFEVELDDQHEAHRFVGGVEPGLHEYVRETMADFEPFGSV